MNPAKHFIRRYLLATLAGFVLGLIGVLARYEDYVKNSSHFGGFTVAQVDSDIVGNRLWRSQVGRHFDARMVLHRFYFFVFLAEDTNNSAGNILLGSTLLLPFAVYTFDVVAASRRKREQGAT
jgi:hypothetical protein